jgi:hypothetical protein
MGDRLAFQSLRTEVSLLHVSPHPPLHPSLLVPTLNVDAQQYVTTRAICQKNLVNKDRSAGLLQPLALAHAPLHVVTCTS